MIIRTRSNWKAPRHSDDDESRLVRRWFFIGGTILLLIALGLSLTLIFSQPGEPRTEMNDVVIATIGESRTITLSTFLDNFRNLYGKEWDMLTEEERTNLARKLLDRIVEKEILLSVADDLQFTSDTSLDSAVTQLMESSTSSLRERTIRREINRSPEEWRELVKKNLLAMKTKDFILNKQVFPITDGDISAYYNNHRERFYREKSTATLKQFVFENAKVGRSSLKNLQQGKTIEEEIARLSKANLPPPELVDLGVVDTSEMDGVEATMVEKTKENEYCGYQQENGEFVVFLVIRKQLKGQLPLQDVSDEIRRIVLKEHKETYFQEWLTEQILRLKVKSNLSLAMKSLTTEAILLHNSQDESSFDESM